MGGLYNEDDLLETALSLWSALEPPFIVCTGGEPLLQMDERLLSLLHAKRCVVAVETNGTTLAAPGIDWITVSPKMGTTLRQTSGNELKLVYPQNGLNPSQYENLAFEHFFLQPMDDPKYPNTIMKVVEYCLEHPKWKLSLQIHKMLAIK